MEQKLLLQDLANLLAEKEGISKRQAEAFVRAFFDITEEALLQDNYIKITGFGTAKLMEVSERESISIHTGERFQIPGYRKVSFVPDTKLRDLINRPFSHFSTITLYDETTEEELAEADKLVDESTLSSEETHTLTEPLEGDDTTAAPQPREEVIEVTTTLPQADHQPASKETKAVEQAEESNAQSLYHHSHFEEKADAEPVNPTPPLSIATAPSSVTEEAKAKPEDGHTISVATAEVSPTDSDEITPITETILVNTNENEQHSRTNYWKIAFLLVATILLFQIGYWAGWRGLFSSYFERRKETMRTSVQIDRKETTTTVEKPSTQPATTPSTSATTTGQPTTSTPSSPSQTDGKTAVKTEGKTETKAEAKPVPQQATTSASAHKKASPHKTTPQQEKPATPQKVDYKKAAEQYQQLPRGSMLIVGTESRYNFAVGDNIYHVAKRVYGSKDFASYIILHNQLDNPDNIPVGKTIKLPKLVERSAVEAGQ